MKKVVIVLSSVLVIMSLFYYSTFMRAKKVIDPRLIKVKNNKDGISVSTMESAKYITRLDAVQLSDTIVVVTVYTTSIYNLFSKKTPEVNISLNDRIAEVIIAGEKIKRKKDTEISTF
jgi:hypothetical protein